MAIDYTRRDFNTIKNDLLRRAETALPEWTDRDPSDFGMLFVDLWSYLGDVLHYYIDRSSRESFLSTATRRESVLSFANLLDYVPNGRTAAVSVVEITNSSSTDAYVLPQYTALRGSDDGTSIACYTTVETTVPVLGTVYVDVYEGSVVLETSFDGALGTSSGTSSQRFAIANTDVVPNTVRLFVKEDGVTNTEYRRVHSISDAVYGERVFTTETDATGTTYVLLGSTTNGFIPPINTQLTVRYTRSSGSSGNYGANVIIGFRDAVSADLNVVSSTAFVGGVDEESIESMRSSIPLATRTQDRAVTLQDFIDITLGVPGVYKASASYNSGSVTIYAVPAQSGYTSSTAASIPITTALKSDVLNEVTPKTLLGVTATVANATTLVPVNIGANIYVNSRYVAGWVISDVQSALNDLFSFDNVKFGQTLSLSDVYRTIVDVEGVDYAEIDPKTKGTFTKGSAAASTVTAYNTSNVTIGASIGFTVASGLGFTNGQNVVAYGPTNNQQASANYVNTITGNVIEYSGTSLKIMVTNKDITGTGLTTWDIRSTFQSITAQSTELLRKGTITLYSYGGITTSV